MPDLARLLAELRLPDGREIHVLNELRGGQGGRVWLAELRGSQASDLRRVIVKAATGWGANLDGTGEYAHHTAAIQGAPTDFRTTHLVPLVVPPLSLDDHTILIYGIAGDSLRRTIPLSAVTDRDSVTSALATVSTDFLTDLNEHPHYSSPCKAYVVVLEWLSHRALRVDERASRLLRNPNSGSLRIGQDLFPNPTVLLSDTPWHSDAIITPARGFVHGDLHGGNILIQGLPSRPDQYWIIDLATWEVDSPLLFDQCYLELAELLRICGDSSLSDWSSICQAIHQENVATPIKFAGVADAMRIVRSQLEAVGRELIDPDILVDQWLLAGVAAGLNYFAKPMIDDLSAPGKSLLMLFAARKLRLHPALRSPTVLVVVDRIDLDTQIAGTFLAADAPNLAKTDSRRELETLLANDMRKIVITTIHKFGEAEGVLNDRENIIVLVDEAHRTQEGDLGRKMRQALPNAFLFGLTGTPINRADRNTFYAFGADEDENGYMSRYGFEDSIRDGATKELHFEPRLVDLHVDQESIDEAFHELTAELTDEERDLVAGTVAKMAVLLKAPERVQSVCQDIAQHFQEKVAPNGFGAQVVTMDRESCLLYKRELDKYLPPEVSDVVMSVNSGEDEYAEFRRDRDAEEKFLDRFRDPNDPLKILIVTSKLLTGFDAPILQTMYLDKPLRDHTLLQAICRTNRPYGQEKTHGLIVDYLGIFDDVAQAIQFDESAKADDWMGFGRYKQSTQYWGQGEDDRCSKDKSFEFEVNDASQGSFGVQRFQGRKSSGAIQSGDSK